MYLYSLHVTLVFPNTWYLIDQWFYLFNNVFIKKKGKFNAQVLWKLILIILRMIVTLDSILAPFDKGGKVDSSVSKQNIFQALAVLRFSQHFLVIFLFLFSACIIIHNSTLHGTQQRSDMQHCHIAQKSFGIDPYHMVSISIHWMKNCRGCLSNMQHIMSSLHTFFVRDNIYREQNSFFYQTNWTIMISLCAVNFDTKLPPVTKYNFNI